MNRYPLWKNLLILFSVLIAGLIALPNVFPNDPAVLVGQRDTAAAEEMKRVQQLLADGSIAYGRIDFEDGDLRVRFVDVDTQLHAADLLREKLAARSTRSR